MVRYLDRFAKVPIGAPVDVLRLFRGLPVGQAHQLNRALRAFFNFLEILGFDEDWLYRLRKAIPKDKIGIDITIPEEDRIREDLRRLPEATLHYQALWSLCLDSGLRLIEAIHVITGFSWKIFRVLMDSIAIRSANSGVVNKSTSRISQSMR